MSLMFFSIFLPSDPRKGRSHRIIRQESAEESITDTIPTIAQPNNRGGRVSSATVGIRYPSTTVAPRV